MIFYEKGKRVDCANAPYFIGQQLKVMKGDHLGAIGELKKVVCGEEKEPGTVEFLLNFPSIGLLKIEVDQISPIVKSMADWRSSNQSNFGDYIHPGDIVDQEMFNHFLNILPPLHYRSNYLQVMEPVDDAENEDGHNYPVYTTFEGILGNWYYIGNCFNNGHENQIELFSKKHIMPIMGARYKKEEGE